jgi:hypothetical protein
MTPPVVHRSPAPAELVLRVIRIPAVDIEPTGILERGAESEGAWPLLQVADRFGKGVAVIRTRPWMWANVPGIEGTPGLSAARSLADLMTASGVQAWPLAGLLAAGYTASTLGGPVAQQGLPGHNLKAPRS